MFYDRQIKYFDYMEKGERLGSGGFAKMEVRNEKCNLQLQISGMHRTDTFTKQIYLIGKNREELLGTIALQKGKGALHLTLRADNLCNGLSYKDLQAIRIPIADGRELFCCIAGQFVSGEVLEDSGLPGIEPNEPASMCVDPEPTASEYAEPEIPAPVEAEPESAQSEVIVSDTQEPGPMLENKWAQLSDIYPHICPFQDERDYLRIGPEDFVVLNQKCYQLVHNSFLLHGYYNYQHLILSRKEWRGEVCYYIGVPGNFYEREKQVAVMFGFESFECEEEPAETGTYGYYMIRVEL